MLRQSLASLVQKIGLSLSFLFATLIAFFRPIEAIQYYPRWAYINTNITSAVTVGGLIALIMALWVISNQKKFWANLVSTIMIGLAAIFNVTKLHFLLSLTPVFALALSLTIRYYPRVRVIESNPSARPTV